ncbi:hypothetical protein [Nonlabens xiamenensis]|uniref:hypothetical protein n=1 Tax=Nonlabens xiamenensis TaxID=2341043 RepID=UPI000F60F864|nr:hypothetical protein [Nonlabens xiamenensis]
MLIIIAVIAAVFFWKDYEYQKEENTRLSNNAVSIRKFDSLRFMQKSYTKDELKEYLQYQDTALHNFLKEERIRINRIEKVITQSLSYRDTQNRQQDLTPILDAIKENRNLKIPVVDSTKCMIIKGYVAYDNDTLSLNITDRKFKNKSDVISYWERNQWSFLGIKTRLFGRKKATVIIKDDCGRTETIVIDKKEK